MRRVASLLSAYFLFCGIAAFAFHELGKGRSFSAVVVSTWKDGTRNHREVFTSDAPSDVAPSAEDPTRTVQREVVTHVGWLPRSPSLFRAISLVQGRDGLRATLGEKVEYLTPDDLLSMQAYDRARELGSLGVEVGIDLEAALAALAARFGVSATELKSQAKLERVRFAPSPTRGSLDGNGARKDALKNAAVASAKYLVRTQRAGRYKFILNAVTGEEVPGFDWARHAGATSFLAQTARVTHDDTYRIVGRMAMDRLLSKALVDCGGRACVGDQNLVALGTTALATIALADLVEAGEDDLRMTLARLADFLRSQQKENGEFMHYFDRTEGKPLDHPEIYASGEAALALARSGTLLHNNGDRAAALKALQYLTGPAWKFFGSRFYFNEEHWTCQALDALGPPEGMAAATEHKAALRFCMDWVGFNRALQIRPGETLVDLAGAYGIAPIPLPRLTPVASKCEAAISVLRVAKRSGVDPTELRALEQQIEDATSLLMRKQFPGDKAYLLRAPEEVRGAFPASEVDWYARIDYMQHGGACLLRASETLETP